MTFAFNSQHPEWTTQQKLWLLGQVDDERTQREIYDDLTAEESEARPEEVERWEGTFAAFKKRLQRLTRDGIDPAINTDTGQKYEFDLGTVRGRYDYWIWLAKTATDIKTRVVALQMVEKLAPRVANRHTDDKYRLRAAAIERMLNDPSVMVEFIALQLAEAVKNGGEKWVIKVLTAWLDSVPSTIKPVLRRVLAKRPQVLTENETQEERVERIKIELQTLSSDQLVKLNEWWKRTFLFDHYHSGNNNEESEG